jgi:hypothetical protein
MERKINAFTLVEVPRAWGTGLPLLIILVALTGLISGCVLPDYRAFLKNEGSEIVITADKVVLQWNPPADPVAKYEVFYRAHGTSNWTKIGEVAAAPQPVYTVQQATVGSGQFDFAVVATNASGDNSEMHTSLDPTANPNTGWYVSW